MRIKIQHQTDVIVKGHGRCRSGDMLDVEDGYGEYLVAQGFAVRAPQQEPAGARPATRPDGKPDGQDNGKPDGQADAEESGEQEAAPAETPKAQPKAGRR